jgi:deoxyribose-phosphate aldolase
MLPRNSHAAHARLLDEVGAVDQVGVEERVAKFTTRSIKKAAKVWGLRTAVSMTDLTTLEGKDTPGKIESLCRKALRPHDDPSSPRGGRVRLPVDGPPREGAASGLRRQGRLGRHGVSVRPDPLPDEAGRGPRAVADGADEVDMVINRGRLPLREFSRVQDEIAGSSRPAAGPRSRSSSR